MSARPPYDYHPLTSRPPSKWPNGRRLAVYVAVGLEDYAFGEGLAEDILPGAPSPGLVNVAWRDYGNRIGGFRLLERLGSLGIAPTILLNTGVYDAAPNILEAARAVGAEFVAHGHRNSDTLATMTPERESEYIAAVARRLFENEGKPPCGWSSPWLAHSAATLDLLSQHGFRYLLDLRLDDQPVWLRAASRPLLAIPYAAEINDSTTQIGRYAGGRDFADMIVDEFDEMREAARDQALVMSVVVHSFISGQPFRLRALTRALRHIASHEDDVWLCRPCDIAAAVDANPRLAANPQS